MIGFLKILSSTRTSTGSLVLQPPTGLAWLLKSSFISTNGAGNSATWTIIGKDGTVISAQLISMTSGVVYDLGASFSGLLSGEPLELTNDQYIQVNFTVAAGSVYLYSAVLERPPNWDVQYLEWQIKPQGEAPPGFASLVATLGYRARKDLM